MSKQKNSAPDPSKRRFLKTAAKLGGGALVMVTGGVVWRAVEQDVFSPFDGPAFEPWQDWKNQQLSGPLALLPSAILASSPHNTQPWLFLVSDNQIRVYADIERNLGSFDPYLREMHIGLGCAVENIAVAAPAFGFQAAVDYHDRTLTGIPDNGGAQLVASITLIKQTPAEHPLYRSIPERHTYRGDYIRDRALDSRILERFKEVARSEHVELVLYSTPEERSRFDDVMMHATRNIISDRKMVHDSEAWFRLTADDVQKYRDGVTMDSVGLPGPVNVAAKILPPMSPDQANEVWLNKTRDSHLATAPMTAMLVVRDRYNAVDNLRAGRAWQRLHLMATRLGLAMHPMNQPVEWVDRLRMTDQLSSTDSTDSTEFMTKFSQLTQGYEGEATFAFRLGWAKQKGALSPRRGMESVLIPA